MAAWDEFAAIYGPVVFNVAISRGFQPADADNLVQEVFMAVVSSVSNWLQRDDRGSFRAWLLRIARNAAVDMITQKATRSLGRDGSEARIHLSILPAPCELSSALDLEYERLSSPELAMQFGETTSQKNPDSLQSTLAKCSRIPAKTCETFRFDKPSLFAISFWL